ncbi:VWA domain-containing protein [Candidatus Dependentiae bacterium]|nr:VWA domain-containing protein [Candidatus Dependentiae bacterium]
MIQFLYLKFLFFLTPIFLVIIAILFLKFFKQKKFSYKLTFSNTQKSLLKNFSLPIKFLKTILLMLSILFLMVAIIRPKWGLKESNVQQMGRDIIFGLDISRSMLVQDVNPNRLELAKKKIKDLINSLPTDRVALMLFSQQAVVSCPLTNDFILFEKFLDKLDSGILSSGSTDISNAISKAIDIFANNKQKKNKIFIMFTDGEDFSRNLSDVKKRASEENIKIITVGVGTPEGGPIPILDQTGKQISHQRNEKGGIVISQLNEIVLNSIAKETGSIYLRATKDDSDIQKVYSFIEKFEKEKFEDKQFSLLEERYYYFALLSLILLLVEWII